MVYINGNGLYGNWLAYKAFMSASYESFGKSSIRNGFFIEIEKQ